MKFGYGAKRFEAGEFALRAFNTTPTRNEKGRLEKITRVLEVNFEIIRDSQADITRRFNEIAAAIRVDGKDVGFYEDDGGRSAIFIDSSETASGVLIAEYPGLSPDDGADYATHHKGSCAFAAEYLPSAFGGGGGGQNELTDYREALSVRGTGGPRIVSVENDRGRPQQFVLADRTTIFAQQSGTLSVISERPYYPAPNPPVWPKLIVGESAEHSKEITPSNDGSFTCTVSWNYQFQSIGPLFGEPRARS